MQIKATSVAKGKPIRSGDVIGVVLSPLLRGPVVFFSSPHNVTLFPMIGNG
jgi:hypothetical protein